LGAYAGSTVQKPRKGGRRDSHAAAENFGGELEGKETRVLSTLGRKSDGILKVSGSRGGSKGAVHQEKGH